MQYDLTSDFQRKAFLSRVDNLLERGAVVELTEKTIRTRGQNNYLHLLIGVVAMETGNTLEYCKEMYFKRLCNKDLFITTRADRYAGQVEVIRSSAEPHQGGDVNRNRQIQEVGVTEWNLHAQSRG